MLNTVEPLLPHVVRTGAWLKAQLEALAYEVQGEGLMLAVAVPDAADYERRLREKGFLVSSTSGEQIRLLPPLIITRDDLRPFIAAMAELKEYA